MKPNASKQGFFHNHLLFKNAFQFRMAQMHKHQQHFISANHAIDDRIRPFLYCGIIGCVLFVLIFFIEGITRVGYDSFRFPISSLAIGSHGWIQRINFIVSGLCIFLFAIGLRMNLRYSRASVSGPLLIALVAIGLIGAGIFSTDPLFGYPNTMPLILQQYSLHGRLHNAFSLPVFIGLPIACFVFSRRFLGLGKSGWSIYSLLTALAMSVTFVLAAIGFNQNPALVEIAGLLQRISIIIGWTWISLLSLHLVSTPKRVS
jgi:hypothetical protein